METRLVSQNLKFLRSRRGVLNSQISQALNIPEKYLISWESGATVPDAEGLRRLSRYYNINAEAIIKVPLWQQRPISSAQTNVNTQQVVNAVPPQQRIMQQPIQPQPVQQVPVQPQVVQQAPVQPVAFEPKQVEEKAKKKEKKSANNIKHCETTATKVFTIILSIIFAHIAIYCFYWVFVENGAYHILFNYGEIDSIKTIIAFYALVYILFFAIIDRIVVACSTFAKTSGYNSSILKFQFVLNIVYLLYILAEKCFNYSYEIKMLIIVPAIINILLISLLLIVDEKGSKRAFARSFALISVAAIIMTLMVINTEKNITIEYIDHFFKTYSMHSLMPGYMYKITLSVIAVSIIFTVLRLINKIECSRVVSIIFGIIVTLSAIALASLLIYSVCGGYVNFAGYLGEIKGTLYSLEDKLNLIVPAIIAAVTSIVSTILLMIKPKNKGN